MNVQVFHDLDLAVKAAAKQNFERDTRAGRVLWNNAAREMAEYEEEARFLLEDSGENYYPDYPDHPHIVYRAP